MSNFILHVEDNFRDKDHTAAAFLDVQGAFDNVNSEILTEKVAQIKRPVKILE